MLVCTNLVYCSIVVLDVNKYGYAYQVGDAN